MASNATPTKNATPPVFDEAKLAEEVARVWGVHGAHAQVLRWLITDSKRYRYLRTKVKVWPADSWSDLKAVKLNVEFPCDPPSISPLTDAEQFDHAIDGRLL